MLFTDAQQLNESAYNALRRIRKTVEPEIKESVSPAKRKYKLQINEFSETAFKTKAKYDSFIYETLMKNFTFAEKEAVSGLINEMESIVKNIYQFLNVEPRTPGFKALTPTDTETKLMQEAKNIVDLFFNKEYYSLTTREREVKYKPAAVEMAYELVVQENIAPETAIAHSYKTLVIENLLDNIHFPFIIKHHMDEMFENSLYNEFFDVQELTDLREVYDTKKHQFARLVASNIN